MEGFTKINWKLREELRRQHLLLNNLALKGHNSGKNQSSMTSIKYAHLQVMSTISGKFHQNPLKTVVGVTETRPSVDKMAKTDKGQ